MKPIESLLEAAIRAPSGDNTQPWRFSLDPDGRRVTIDVDPARDPSPMNAGQRMARIAIGAALENMLRVLEKSGLKCDWSIDPKTAVVTLDFDAPANAALTRDEAIFSRVTNRREYDGRPIPPEVQSSLSQVTPAGAGRAIHWVLDRGRLPELGELIASADATMFAVREMRMALLSNVRFDAPRADEVRQGLSLASLEIPRFGGPGFKFLCGLSDKWFKRFGGSGTFARLARRLVASASGLCFITAADNRPAIDIHVGITLERAWLALTQAGLAAQPMMSLPVLENVFEHGSPLLQGQFDRTLVEELSSRFTGLVPESAGRRLAFLLRFGYAPPPSGRTGRLPWQQLAVPAHRFA